MNRKDTKAQRKANLTIVGYGISEMTPEDFDRQAKDPDRDLLCDAVNDETYWIEVELGATALTRPQIYAYSVDVYFGLTSNGGFQSLFGGAYTWIVPYCVDALRCLGFEPYANAISQAIECAFPGGVPSDDTAYDAAIDAAYERFERSELSEKFSDPFEIYEDPFWENFEDDKDSIIERVHAYILSNRESFIGK